MCANSHIAFAWLNGAKQDTATFINVMQNPENDIICEIDRSVKCAVE